ncbi:MAG TPA: hypothetical protein DD979_16175 [Gammaproteobacteria bacterium]|nr:hypothetical protein [Gammaproteobacteria bacterium]
MKSHHNGLKPLKRIEFNLKGAQNPWLCFDRNRYFYTALQDHSHVPVRIRPLSCALFAKLRAKNIRGSFILWNKWAKFARRSLPARTTDHIGQFDFVYGRNNFHVAIDIADGRHLHDRQILDHSDLYFKCNAWPSVAYPQKVVPLINGNGTLSPEKIEHLKTLRATPKTYDLVYWSRVWAAPGDDPENNGVEHNVRLFEALAQVEGKKNLLAVFPRAMNTSSLSVYRDRLDKAGVPWQNGWTGIDSRALWQNLAAARISFLRPGNHLCVSWRMMDLLCMGACIMVDGAPFPEWPEPLRENVNFIDAGCTLGADYSMPSSDSYKRMVQKISALIKDDATVQHIAGNNSQYFDQYAAMPAISDYILATAENRFTRAPAETAGH